MGGQTHTEPPWCVLGLWDGSACCGFGTGLVPDGLQLSTGASKRWDVLSSYDIHHCSLCACSLCGGLGLDGSVVSRQPMSSSAWGCAVAGGKHLSCAQQSIAKKLGQKGWRQLRGRPRRLL